MKKHTIIIIIFALFINSCSKHRTQAFKYRVIGYIYNSIDSTPFVNTQFKVYQYSPSNLGSKSKTEETFFYTDDGGHFDITCSHAGILVWPSYHMGAAYIGPPYLGNGVKSETDEVNKIYITYFDTLYTTPYH